MPRVKKVSEITDNVSESPVKKVKSKSPSKEKVVKSVRVAASGKEEVVKSAEDPKIAEITADVATKVEVVETAAEIKPVEPQIDVMPEKVDGKKITQTEMSLKSLEEKTIAELRKQANEIGMKNFMELPKRDLIIDILKVSSEKEGYIFIEGILEVMKDSSHGVIRTDGVLPGENDVYISGSQIKKFNLKTGDIVGGPARLPKQKERYLSLLRVDTVYGREAALAADRPHFSKLTPIYPNRQIKLEYSPEALSNRIIDLVSPIGFGQRALIVAPPKAGKTTLLKEIATGISINHPEAKLIVVLVAERPEEVTDLERSVKGDVYASNFDQRPEHNCAVAEMALEKAKRAVEWGEDVIVLMDSITRLARAYNITMPTSGRTLSGGFDPVALYPPKRFFGAARNFEKGGSLTIIATALVDTGSRMDDLVYEEFKGTGNMELHLDRKLQQKRIFPAIDIINSGTRNEDLLLEPDVLNRTWMIRRMLEMIDSNEHPTEVLIERMSKTKTNKEFLASLH